MSDAQQVMSSDWMQQQPQEEVDEKMKIALALHEIDISNVYWFILAIFGAPLKGFTTATESLIRVKGGIGQIR